MSAPLLKKINWAEELAAFFDAGQHDAFAYGEADCCLFAANGIKAMTVVDLIAPYRGLYTSQEDIQKIVADEKASCLTSLVRRVLKETGLQTKLVSFAMHVDYYPANVGLSDGFAHGAELQITEGITPEQAIADYLPIAAQSLWAVIEEQFPGRYTVGL